MERKAKNTSKELEVYIDEKYMNDTYDSCKNVVYPSSGNLAMDLACGVHDASRCNAKLWYEFQGDPVANGFIAFRMIFITDKPYWNEPTKTVTNNIMVYRHVVALTVQDPVLSSN